MMRLVTLVSQCTVGVMLWLMPHAATAKPLVADLSRHLIAIDSGFTGTEVLLFGARNDSGDIVVVIRGPESNVTIRKKEHYAGLWINRKTTSYTATPAYYYMVSTRPLDAMGAQPLFEALNIGTEQLMPKVKTAEEQAFRQAWYRNRESQGLYQMAEYPVAFMGETLFKTVVPFSKHIPRGTYTAEIYLISDGRLIGAQSTPLVVDKRGLDATIFEIAHRLPALYGILCVLIALIAGWLAGMIFRKA